MSHSYNYQLNFWDEQDNGVKILLEHIHQGIQSCKTMEHFFEERCKLEKDYSRRLGAIAYKFDKNLSTNPDYGKLLQSLKLFQETQGRIAKAHSIQAIHIHTQNYKELRSFISDLMAKYTTIDGKVRSLRSDKITKRQLCSELKEKLAKATVELRDCQLNQLNKLGVKESSANEKQLSKWSSIVEELQIKIDVLQQEYKASTQHWFQEWAELSLELQNMEEQRIHFMKAKMQEYTGAVMETCVQEQNGINDIEMKLGSFTAQHDISNFAYNHGTGRIKGKIRVKNRPYGEVRENSVSVCDDYVNNVRSLSSKLHRSRIGSDDTQTLQRQNAPVIPPKDIEPVPLKSLIQNPRSKDETRAVGSWNNAVGDSLQKGNIDDKHKPIESTSSESSGSSNPTDSFPTRIHRHDSLESNPTSISSIVSGIDESQRLAKSWNSHNRRKSRNSLNLEYSQQERYSRSNSMETTRVSSNGLSTVKSSRRKSMAFQDGQNPLKSALQTMKQKETSRVSSVVSDRSEESDTNCLHKPFIPFPGATASRQTTQHYEYQTIVDDCHTVELPTYTVSGGEKVIKYAKALYTYMEPNENNLVNFRVDDYILLTKRLNQDWYLGEVYNAGGIEDRYRCGLVPANYIEILS